MLGEVPQEIEVTIQIHADTGVDTGYGGGWVAVLAPEVAVGLIVADTIGVGHGDEDNARAEGSLDVGVGVGLVAVGQALTVLVCVQKI